jgi:iron uptake system component EfeO
MSYRLFFFTVAVAAVMLSCSPSSTKEPKVSEAPLAVPSGVVDAYRTWVLSQTDGLLTQTDAFVAAVEAGDRPQAQRLYAPARMFYESIEPIAEALGDLDPRLDAREGDVPQDQWGGFHKLEKLLWAKDDLKGGAGVAKVLANDVHLLRAKVETAQISVSSMVTGAVELLNEVSTSKVTGEEERYSHTDLWDFRANVDGAQKIWTLLAPSVKTADPDLAEKLDQRFLALDSLLDSHKTGGTFKLYGELKPAEVKALSAAVDGVAEPLSQLGKLFSGETKAN